MNTLQSKAYVTQLAKAIAADGRIDASELRRIYEVMSAFEIQPDSRAEILDLLYFDQKTLISVEVDSSIIDDDEIRLSLAKDLLFVESQEGNEGTEIVVHGILNRLKVTPEQMKFLGDWVSWENAALRRLGAGETELADEGGLKELTSRAAAIGVPLSALYFAGAAGFGAIGLSTGLATLGGASGLVLLGLNPMTAGIAALIVAGISVKKIVDFGLGRKKRQIEAALQRSQELRERYRQYLLHDMTEFEKSSISDWLAGRRSKRKKAISTFRSLITESLQNPQ